MTSSVFSGPARSPEAYPQHRSKGSSAETHNKLGRFFALALSSASLALTSQGICCHLLSSGVGLIISACFANSPKGGKSFFALGGSCVYPAVPSDSARAVVKKALRIIDASPLLIGHEFQLRA